MLYNYYKKIYSQNGEDGIIEYLLSKCNYIKKTCLEIGVYDGVECNTANLIKNERFSGILIDNSDTFNHCFYKDTSYKFIRKHLETDNINDFFIENGLINHYDVFSLDIDGIDYWILKEIIEKKLLTASIIVLEYQDIIGSNLSLTIPNIKNFCTWNYDHYEGPNYCGASLKAFINLLKDEYVFVGCEPSGFNGFFLNKFHTSYTGSELKDISVCFENEKVKFGMQNRWPRTKNMNWITV
jgi:hypothetical protein